MSLPNLITFPVLHQVTGELGGASALEVTRFFLVLMRQLNRTLCGGTCVYSRSRANPYAHTSSRCQAFLALLQVLGKVAPEVTLSEPPTLRLTLMKLSPDTSYIAKDYFYHMRPILSLISICLIVFITSNDVVNTF